MFSTASKMAASGRWRVLVSSRRRHGAAVHLRETQREVVIDFSLYPLALAEIASVPRHQRIGPMLVDERSCLPYAEMAYTKRWRTVANTAVQISQIWQSRRGTRIQASPRNLPARQPGSGAPDCRETCAAPNGGMDPLEGIGLTSERPGGKEGASALPDSRRIRGSCSPSS